MATLLILSSVGVNAVAYDDYNNVVQGVDATSTDSGVKISPTEDLTLNTVYLDASVQTAHVVVQDGAHNQIYDGDGTNMNLQLLAVNDYYVVVNNYGSSYQMSSANVQPFSSTYFNYLGGYVDWADTTDFIYSISGFAVDIVEVPVLGDDLNSIAYDSDMWDGLNGVVVTANEDLLINTVYLSSFSDSNVLKIADVNGVNLYTGFFDNVNFTMVSGETYQVTASHFSGTYMNVGSALFSSQIDTTYFSYISGISQGTLNPNQVFEITGFNVDVLIIEEPVVEEVTEETGISTISPLMVGLFAVISTLISEVVALMTGDLLVLTVVASFIGLIVGVIYSISMYVKNVTNSATKRKD